MSDEPIPSLKLVTIDPASPDSLAAVRRALADRAGDSEVEKLFSHGLIVNTSLDTSEVREVVSAALGDDQEVVVVEFERWSARGESVDGAWLMRRGH